MKFQFTRRGLNERSHMIQRALEILPGFLSWSILIAMVVLSFTRPLLAAILVIVFDLYWLFRLFYMTLFLVLSYLRLEIERHTDWLGRAAGLKKPQAALKELTASAAGRDWRHRASSWFYAKDLAQFAREPAPSPAIGSIIHVVIVPVAKELRGIIEPGVASLAEQTFPRKQIWLFLAVEERAPAAVKADVKEVASRYREVFGELKVIEHPSGLPGEARVKGANTTYAARAAAEMLKKQGIALDNVIASCFDADTVVSPQYMACLTYHFLATPHRNQASFQPIPVYHNNIWEAPGITRVLDIGASFFQLIEATNPETLVTFSSHSMSFRALVDVGYWPVDMISDDSAIYWKAYIHYDGEYQVIPMYVTVSMDVVAADSWWQTVRNVYRQKRRWAWGVENIPIVIRAFLHTNAIPLYDRLRLSVKLIGGHVAWATWAFLLTFIGWLPALVASREFSDTVWYYGAPRVTGIIFNLASLALVTTVILSLCLLPKEQPPDKPLLRRLVLAVEWLLVPLIAVFLSALPALDAQTRLMLGRYMEFWVTDKKRTG